MEKRFLNSMNYNADLASNYEKGGGESLTIPDQSLTIRQILERFTRGQVLDVAHHDSIGYDDPDFDDVDPTLDPAFDIIDAYNLKNEIQERQKNRQKAVEKSRQTIIDEAIEREAQTKVERSE